MPLHCPQCSEFLAVSEGNRLSPWCPRCGAELRADKHVHEVAHLEGSLEHSIERTHQSQNAKQQERRQNRRAGLSAFLGGLAFLGVGAFVSWFNAWWEGQAVVPVRLLLVLLIPLGISLTGLYSFLTGQKTLAIKEDVQEEIKSHARE
jgi:hypothetical protein